jgi:hypothetical protein
MDGILPNIRGKLQDPELIKRQKGELKKLLVLRDILFRVMEKEV